MKEAPSASRGRDGWEPSWSWRGASAEALAVSWGSPAAVRAAVAPCVRIREAPIDGGLCATINTDDGGDERHS